jgi:hypothetical protein
MKTLGGDRGDRRFNDRRVDFSFNFKLKIVFNFKFRINQLKETLL